MSKIMDMVEEEAIVAEMGEDDGEAAEDDETVEEEPEPTPEPDAADVTKAVKQLEREGERHTKRVAEIMGADFALVHPCPTCQDFAAGFTLTAPEGEVPMVQATEYERCTHCNGYGVVLTGALADHGRVQTCLTCNGQGFTHKASETPSLSAVRDEPSPHASLANELRAQGYMVIEPPAPAQRPQAV